MCRLHPYENYGVFRRKEEYADSRRAHYYPKSNRNTTTAYTITLHFTNETIPGCLRGKHVLYPYEMG